MINEPKDHHLETRFKELLPQHPVETGDHHAKMAAVMEASYSEADVMRWQQGAKEFESFYNSLTFAAKERLIEWNNLGIPRPPGCLQAVFLGEKPSCQINANPELENKLQLYGLRVRAGICFRPQAVLDVRKKYDEAFAGLPDDDADEIVEKVAHSHANDQECKVLGLLFGFPKAAIDAFTLNVKDRDRKVHKVHGIVWTDDSGGSESDAWAKRLDAAFTQSDMLAIELGIDQFEFPLNKYRRAASNT